MVVITTELHQSHLMRREPRFFCTTFGGLHGSSISLGEGRDHEIGSYPETHFRYFRPAHSHNHLQRRIGMHQDGFDGRILWDPTAFNEHDRIFVSGPHYKSSNLKSYFPCRHGNKRKTMKTGGPSVDPLGTHRPQPLAHSQSIHLAPPVLRHSLDREPEIWHTVWG